MKIGIGAGAIGLWLAVDSPMQAARSCKAGQRPDTEDPIRPA